jgi:hypothetical protein
VPLLRGRTETPALLGPAVLVDDHPRWSGAVAAEERRGRRGSGPSAVARRAQPGGSSSGSALRMDSDDGRGTWSNGDTLPLGAGSARRRPPAVEQSSSCRSTARAAGQRPQHSGPAGPARGQRLRLSPVNRQRRQSGYVVERRHSPSWGRQWSSTTTRSGAGRQRQRNGGGGGAAAPAQRPGGPSPGAASPAQPGDWAATTVGVRGRTETVPLLGQAMVIDDHPQWSGAAVAEERRGRLGSGPSAVAHLPSRSRVEVRVH